MLHGNGYFSTLSVTASRFEGGNPGKEEQQTKVAKFVGESALIRYGLESDSYFDDRLFLYGGVSARFDKNLSSAYYPLDHIGYGNNRFMEYGAATYKIVPEISADFTPVERLKGSARIAGEWERAEARGDSKEWSLDRWTLMGSGDLYYQIFKYGGLGGEGSVQFLKDDLNDGVFVQPSGSHILEDASDRDATFAGRLYTRLGASESPLTGEVSIGRFYQQPALMELYGTFPGALSNPNLKREKATKFEAAGLYKFRFVLRILSRIYMMEFAGSFRWNFCVPKTWLAHLCAEQNLNSIAVLRNSWMCCCVRPSKKQKTGAIPIRTMAICFLVSLLATILLRRRSICRYILILPGLRSGEA